jgi:PAS domain S-box-containing protein
MKKKPDNSLRPELPRQAKARRVVINDITGRKSANSLLDTVIDSSPFAMWISDREGMVIRTNRSLRETLNLTDEQLIGKYNVLKDANLEMQGVMPMVRAVFEMHTPARFIIPWKASNAGDVDFTGGRDLYINVSIFPILDNNGELTNVVCQWVNITEHKQAEESLQESEQKFRDTIKHLDEGYYSCTAEGLLLEHNLAFNRILGFDPAQDMKGKKLPDFWKNPEDRKEYLDELMTKGFVRNYMINAKKSGGEKITVLANAHLIKDEQDRLVKIVGTFTDFTDRKRAEEEILQLNEQLGQKASELEQVIFIASHDLRSPLVNVQGFSKELGYSIKEIENLLETVGNPDSNKTKLKEILAKDIPETLHYIQSSIAKMDSLLAGLLKISRIGRVELTMENLDMNSFIKEIAGTFEYQIADKAIAFTVSDLPVCRGDKVQINQVFSNIVDNAIKYGDPKRPCKISISGKSEKGRAIFCVEDNGIGIAREHMGKIFEIFHRLNPADTSGEGLGLAIVQRILLKHKGTVRVESELGEGSRFFIELPV